MQKTILVDICNTIADINGALKERGHIGNNFVYPLVNADKIFLDFTIFVEAPPLQPIVSLVQSLKGYQVIYLTARPLETKQVTRRWLDRYSLPEGQPIFSDGRPKGAIARELSLAGVNIVGAIEDSPTEIMSYRKSIPGMRIIVPVWGYNASVLGLGNIIPIQTRKEKDRWYSKQERTQEHILRVEANPLPVCTV